MVSSIQQHEHCAHASRAICSVLTRAVAVLLCAVKSAAIELLQTARRALPW
jgi:hypothetical protein